jgi:penicillin-binding protein 1B
MILAGSVRDSENSRLSFRERLESISARSPRPIKRIASIVFKPQTALIFGAMAIVFSVFAIHYYNELASEIDARLESASLDNTVQLLSSPLKVSIGDRLPIEELKSYLREAGYHQKPGSTEDDSTSSFTSDADSILIKPGRESANRFRLNPVRIRFDKEGRINSLTGAQSGERLDSALIEGELMASLRDGDRRKKIVVGFSDIPETLRNAILSVEDRRFFAHRGIDFRSILRALKADMNQGEIAQGGSTITQQLIKNSFLSSDRTFKRKLKEAAMAMILESRLSKEKIFEHYFNEVYLGQSGTFAAHGFAQAAQIYFDKEIKDLTLSESAFLAGLIHAPNRYAARRDMNRAIERRNHVLDAMTETGAITEQQAAKAMQDALEIKRHEVQDDFGATYFVDYAQSFVEERFGGRRLATRQQITTTLDPRLQRAAFDAVNRNSDRLDKVFARSRKKGEAPEKIQTALVAIDTHTGEVLAMIGGRSYDESQLNRATDSMRQPGSTFKPFVYAAALGSRSYTAASMLSDRPQSFSYDGGRREYKPTNYHGGFTNRDVSLREALARSLNVPTVELAMRVGLGNISALGQECGLENLRAYPSMALGASEVTPLALAGAYTAFANGGVALRPIPVRSLEGNDQAANSEKISATGVRVFTPQVAYLMTTLMQSVVDVGTASKLRSMGVKGAIAGKTGTSNDGWFVGYTPGLVCAAWVGFDDNRDLRMKASDAALPLWADFMKQALDLRPSLGGESFAKPGGLVTVNIDPTTGNIAGPECATHREEIFISGTDPVSMCSHQTLAENSELYPISEESTETPDSYSFGEAVVEVCSESGLVASSNCKRTVKRTFDSGSEPHEICSGEGHSEEGSTQLSPLDPPSQFESEKIIDASEKSYKSAARRPREQGRRPEQRHPEPKY